MDKNNVPHTLMRKLPGVDHVLELTKKNPFFKDIPKTVIVRSTRLIIDDLRSQLLSEKSSVTEKSISDERILKAIKKAVTEEITLNLLPLINATGIVVHTNLGRSLLPPEAIDHVLSITNRYSNLEFDLASGKRGSRYSAVEDLICELCDAESALVVNNNAGAVLLCLESLARGNEVIVSRGELVEIGGAFRIPDVMAKSGGILKEVGTTNRTHLKDYEGAIGDNTALLLKVHQSNYSVVGFTSEVSLNELVSLGKKYHIPVMEDLGSGTFIDFSKYGLEKEQTVKDSVKSGADIVTFSGDKLLGGPQAGIIVGRTEMIEKIKKNPLTRALRIDKLTLAALESTLRLYRDEAKAIQTIPTLQMLLMPLKHIEERADKLKTLLEEMDEPKMSFRCIDCNSKSGGGALPLLSLPSRCISLSVAEMSPNALETAMRENNPPIIGRIEDDLYIMDLRTVQDNELTAIPAALESILKGN